MSKEAEFVLPIPEIPLCRPGALQLIHELRMLGLVIDATRHLKAAFGTRAVIIAERVDGPDSEQAEPNIYLIATTNMNASSAREALDRFEEEWWLDNMDRAGGRMHIGVDFSDLWARQ